MLMLANESELRAIYERAAEQVRLAADGPKAAFVGVGGPATAKPSGDENPGWALVGERSALVSVCGPMCKDVDRIAEILGISYTSLVKFEQAMSEAAAAVGPGGEIVLDIDSPGGSVRGEADFLEVVRDVRNCGIRVIAYAHDLCGSAAYLLACQCEKIACGPQARVGSIGTVVAIKDTSKAMEQMGVSVKVVSSGGVKGMGTDGAPVTEPPPAAVQQSVNDITAWFVAEVAAGRGMTVEAVSALATGELWLGEDAGRLGLCDRVIGFRELLRAMAEPAGSKR